MVELYYDDFFLKRYSKIKNKAFKKKIKKQIAKIIKNPETGKPMSYSRKGTREVYVGSYRISYSYSKDKIVLLNLYHKNKQ
ncbi:MAG: hypothetical protein MAG795_00795 [Candidatus Woesearchaeota archaeon]|nr:hypothetical protein [Candidatus Woesearchaeota archaeon]